MYALFVFVVGWLVGTLITLRVTKIEGNPYHLTSAGKIVYASAIGLLVGGLIVFLDGMWWNCDSGTCNFHWGY